MTKARLIPKRAVSQVTLLRGSWYALEQRGRLFNSAVLLYDNGDASTAVALAMFGREELGRSRILRGLAQRAKAGESLTVEIVRNACEEHLDKQGAGALSTGLTAEAPSRIDVGIRKRRSERQGSKAWREASETVDSATDAKRKRQPHDRHEMRLRALYVDLAATGDSWLRPAALDPRQCLREICEALNDYIAERDRLRPDVCDTDFPEMSKALAGMDPKPILLNPRRPKGE